MRGEREREKAQAFTNRNDPYGCGSVGNDRELKARSIAAGVTLRHEILVLALFTISPWCNRLKAATYIHFDTNYINISLFCGTK